VFKHVDGIYTVRDLDIFENNPPYIYQITPFCNGGDLRGEMNKTEGNCFSEEKAIHIIIDIIK